MNKLYFFFALFLMKTTVYGQTPSIEFAFEYTVVNQDTTWLNSHALRMPEKKLERLLGEKPKKVREKEYGATNYCFVNIGVTGIAPADDLEQSLRTLQLHYRFNGNILRKTKCYNGELTLFGVRITQKTTFLELYNNENFRQLIEPGQVPGGSIVIYTKFAEYNILFEDNTGHSGVKIISATNAL